MLFNSLNKLRGHCTAIGLSLSFVDEDKVKVIVTPMVDPSVGAKAAHLGMPFELVGTASELDAEFAGQFGGFATAHADLTAQVQTQIERLKQEAAKTPLAAKKAAGKAASTTLAIALQGGTPVESSGSDDDESSDVDDDAGSGSSAAGEPVGAVSAEALF